LRVKKWGKKATTTKSSQKNIIKNAWQKNLNIVN
jgi:hypothetical protein